MNTSNIKHFFADLRYLTLFPRRYEARPGMTHADWKDLRAHYAGDMKKLANTHYRWRVITYDDGHKELVYLRVLRGGIVSGGYPGIYRGIIIPRLVKYATYSRMVESRIAF